MASQHQSAQEFLYYQIYANDTLIPIKAPYVPEDDTLGRIPARRIAPPRTVRNIKNCIAQIEGFTFEAIEDVYIDSSDSEFKPLDEQDRIPFTEDVVTPLCVVLGQPFSLTSQTAPIPISFPSETPSAIATTSTPRRRATAADDTGRFFRGHRSELFDWLGYYFLIHEEGKVSMMIASLTRACGDERTAHTLHSVLEYLRYGRDLGRIAYREVWNFDAREHHTSLRAPAQADASVASTSSRLRLANLYQTQGIENLFMKEIRQRLESEVEQDVINTLDKAIRLDPKGCHSSNLYKALACFASRNTPAEPSLTYLRSFTRDEADARVLLSFAYLIRADYKSAWEQFQEVVKLDQGSSPVKRSPPFIGNCAVCLRFIRNHMYTCMVSWPAANASS